MHAPHSQPPNPTPFVYQPPPGIPALVHVDEALVVVDKPAGLLSVPGRLPAHHDSAVHRLQAAFGTLWVVHRLDMDTSGLIVFARNRQAAAHLGRQFERRTVDKRYEALVWGRPASTQATISLPLRVDWPTRPRQLVDGQRGKPAITRLTCLAHSGIQSRLMLTPLTGRSHQLRVHLSAIGLPIVGDRFYGLEAAHGVRADSAPRLMLHARELRLEHPTSGDALRWQAEVPF